MDSPQEIIKRLLASDMTEEQIASALREDGVAVTQPTIWRIKSGETRNPKFSVGMGLLRLYERRRAAGLTRIN